MMHNTNFKGRRMSVRQVHPCELTPVQRARIENAQAMAQARYQAAMAQSERGMNAAAQRSESASWFALVIRGRAALKVAETLESHKIKVYAPAISSGQRRLRGRYYPPCLLPVFPHYVFVKVVPDNEMWAALLGLDAVAGVVGTAAGPSSISSRDMNKLNVMADNGWVDEDTISEVRKLPIGANVRILHGPFIGFEAPIGGYVGTRSVRLLAQVFGRETPMVLGLDEIVAV